MGECLGKSLVDVVGVEDFDGRYGYVFFERVYGLGGQVVVSDDVGVGDEGGFWICEEGDYVCDFGGLVIVIDCYVGIDDGGDWVVCWIYVGIGWFWMDGVDCDFFGFEVVDEIVVEVSDGVFG